MTPRTTELNFLQSIRDKYKLARRDDFKLGGHPLRKLSYAVLNPTKASIQAFFNTVFPEMHLFIFVNQHKQIGIRFWVAKAYAKAERKEVFSNANLKPITGDAAIPKPEDKEFNRKNISIPKLFNIFKLISIGFQLLKSTLARGIDAMFGKHETAAKITKGILQTLLFPIEIPISIVTSLVDLPIKAGIDLYDKLKGNKKEGTAINSAIPPSKEEEKKNLGGARELYFVKIPTVSPTLNMDNSHASDTKLEQSQTDTRSSMPETKAKNNDAKTIETEASTPETPSTEEPATITNDVESPTRPSRLSTALIGKTLGGITTNIVNEERNAERPQSQPDVLRSVLRNATEAYKKMIAEAQAVPTSQDKSRPDDVGSASQNNPTRGPGF